METVENPEKYAAFLSLLKRKGKLSDYELTVKSFGTFVRSVTGDDFLFHYSVDIPIHLNEIFN